MVAVGAYTPIQIGGGFEKYWRHRIAPPPQLYRPIINGVSAEHDFGAGISGVFVRANLLQYGTAARLIVTVKYVCCTINCSTATVNKFCSNRDLQHSTPISLKSCQVRCHRTGNSRSPR